MEMQDRERQFWTSAKWEPALAWIVVLCYCIFSASRYAENILVTYAYVGWSPMDWVNHRLHPENFKADFPSGIGVYEMSSFMQLYLHLASLGVDLERLIPWGIVFETVFLGVGAAVAFRALAPRASYAAMTIFVLLVVQGDVGDMELSRFGGAFYQGLYYNVADALKLLGLAMLFQRRVVVAALLLGVGCTVHPVLTGMACIFAVPYIVLIWKSLPLRQWAIACAVFAGTAGIWLASRFLLHPAEVASGGIAAETWLAFVRLFTVHFFSVDIGVFTRRHTEYIVPLLCLVSLAVHFLPRVVTGREERRGIAWGMVFLGLLSCAGVLIPEVSNNPFLIKLALHRASAILIVVSLLIAVAGLAGEVFHGRIAKTALAGALLLSPLVSSVAFPLIPTVALIGIHLWESRKLEERWQSYARLASIGVLLACALTYHVAGIADWAAYWGSGLFWESSSAFSRFSEVPRGGKRLFWEIAVAFMVVWCVREAWRRSMPRVSGLYPLLSAVLVAVTLLPAIYRAERRSALAEDWKATASDYLIVQRWARANTPPASLFMVDPTIYYGWRDFSQRSSFGNLREWLHTSWYYDSKRKNYEEGIRRFTEFGVSIEPYFKIRPSNKGFTELSEQVGRSFYRMDGTWLRELSRKYGIDYLVLAKAQVVHAYELQKVFENGSFVVYRLGT